MTRDTTAGSVGGSSGLGHDTVAPIGALTTLRTPSGTRAAVVCAAGYELLDAPDVGMLLRDSGWQDVVAEAASAPRNVVPINDVDYAPLVTAPGKVLCCGHNYRGHITEMGRQAPAYPTIFAKFADTLIGAYDTIVVAAEMADTLDWEGELAVIIGATVSRADQATARAAIAGYTIANDISVRSWQRHTGQWLPGKAFDATTPLGPVMVPADTFDPTDGHQIRCTVNTTVEQASDVDDLVFTPADLIVYISAFTTLRPGDVILTGTPAGVGAAADPPRYLAHDDVVITEIEGLGRCANRVVVSPSPLPPERYADV